jgi:hypothetical protein
MSTNQVNCPPTKTPQSVFDWYIKSPQWERAPLLLSQYSENTTRFLTFLILNAFFSTKVQHCLDFTNILLQKMKVMLIQIYKKFIFIAKLIRLLSSHHYLYISHQDLEQHKTLKALISTDNAKALISTDNAGCWLIASSGRIHDLYW